MLLNALVFPAMLATPVTEVGYNDFLTMIDNKQVKEVAMEEDQILFTGHRRKRPDRHLQDGPLAGMRA